jgi:predicted GNAT family N-acyltransferase
MPLIVKPVETEAERAEAYSLRREVFVFEQRVPEEIEQDEHDAAAFHVVAVEDGRCLGTGRLVVQPGGVGRVGRMAVDRRRRRGGLGALLLEALEARARALGLREIELHAQCYVERFYGRHGYRREGEVFQEAGIDHVVMRKGL